MTYFNWHDAQPDNYGNTEECVEISNAASIYEAVYYTKMPFVPGWNDVNCATKLKPLCERLCLEQDCVTNGMYTP